MARNLGDIGAFYPSAAQGSIAGIQNMQNVLGVNDALNKRYADAETLRNMQFAAPNAANELQPFTLAGLTVPEDQINKGFIPAKGGIMPREVVPEAAPAPVAPAPVPAPAAVNNGNQSVVFKDASKRPADAGLRNPAQLREVRTQDMTREEFMSLPEGERKQRVSDFNTGRKYEGVPQYAASGLGYWASGPYDVMAAPLNLGLGAVNWIGDKLNYSGFARNQGWLKPNERQDIVPVIGDGSLTPMANQMMREHQDALNKFKPMSEADVVAGLKPFAGKPGQVAAAPTDKASLFSAMQYVESRGNPNAISPKGATGLMQVMPSTAVNPGFGIPNIFDFAKSQGLIVDMPRNEASATVLLKNPGLNRAYGQVIMSTMLDRYKDTDRALVAYNWGPGSADAWIKSGADPAKLPKETRDYLTQIKSKLGSVAAAPVRVAIGDSVAEGFAKANNLQGSYKVGASPTAVLGMLKDYASKNSLQGVEVYLGSGMPNNPAEKAVVEQQIQFILDKGGKPVLFGVGPGTDKKPTTGQNEYLAGLAQQYKTEFTGGLNSLFPSIKKNDPMGLHLNDKQYKTLYGMLTTNKGGGTGTAPIVAANANVPAAAADANAAAASPIAAADATRKVVLGPDLSKNPPNQAQFDMDTKNLITEREFITTQAKAMENSVKQGLNNELARVQMEHQNASAEYNFVKSQYDAAMRTGNRPLMMQLQPQLNQVAAKINTIQTSYNNAAKSAQDQITQLNQQLYGAMKNNEVALWAANARMAYSELVSTGDPRRMQAVWSQYSGGNKVEIQQRTDGKWNLSINGVRSPTAFDTNTLVSQFRETVEEPIRALNAQTAAARGSFLFQETTKSALKQQEQLAQQLGEAQIKMIEGKLQIQKELVGFNKPVSLENGKAIVFPKDPASGIAFMIDVNPESFGEDGVLKPSAIQPVRLGVQAAGQKEKK